MNQGTPASDDSVKLPRKRRALTFLFFVLLSCGFWLLVSLSKSYTSDLVFQLKYEKLPPHLVITSPLPTELFVQAKATGWQLMGLESKTIASTLKVDMSKFFRMGYISTRDLIKPSGSSISNISILFIGPDSIYLESKEKFIKRVPVKLESTIDFAPQYYYSEATRIQPDSIDLIGTEEALINIESWQSKPLVLNKLEGNQKIKVSLAKTENPAITLSDTVVQVSVFVEKFTEETITIPIHINGSGKQSLELFPKNIEISYRVSLSKYENISADQFVASVEYEQALSSTANSIPVLITEKPDQIISYRHHPREVKFILRQ